MKRHKSGEWWAAALCVLPIVLFMHRDAQAHPGKFWYGLYNVSETGTWGDSVWRIMADTFHMNYALTTINEQDRANGVLQRAKDAGIKIMQWGVREPGPDSLRDSALIFWKYSSSSYLQLQADPDTILYYWDAYKDTYTQQWRGVFTRYDSCNASLDSCSSCSSCCSGPVRDPLADNDSAYYFRPNANHCGDSIDGYFFGDINRYPAGRTFKIDFHVRAEAQNCSDTLARLVIRLNVKPNWSCPDTFWVDLAQQYLTCQDFPDTTYKTFTLTVPGGQNWWLHAFVFSTGKAKLWVDWFRVYDEQGIAVMTQPQAAAAITNYINRYSYGHDSTILGFYQREELWEDANVLPQAKVASLIRGASASLTSFTEHHYLFWWENRHRYGGRNAASGRLEQLYGSPVSGMFYPYAGYHFVRRKPPSNPFAAGIDTVLALDGSEPCWTTDTSICLQQTMDSVAKFMGIYKGFCDSTSNKFVPHVQAYSWHERLTPDSCHETDSPWKIGVREQTEGEAKLLASMALANGANGLVYYVYGDHGSTYIDSLVLKCRDSTTQTVHNWMNITEWMGFVSLPGVQNALKHYVGPLVDSLGYLFYDFDWQGAARIDPAPNPDTGAVGALFDSVQNLSPPPPYTKWIHASVFMDGSSQYFFLVNRRAYDTIPQTIRTWLHRNAGMCYIVDMYSQDTTLIGSRSGGSMGFTTSLNPGEGKLFKVVPLQSTVLDNNQLRAWLSGLDSGMYYVKEILSDGSFGDPTLTGTMPDHHTPFTATFASGQSKSFKIFPGPTPSVSGSSLPATWQGGIQVGGDVTMTAGRTWTILPPARVVVTADSDYCIDVRGNLVAEGTATEPIQFVPSVDNTNMWNGITVRGAGNVSMNHVYVQDAYRGLWLLNTTNTISATINHCLFSQNYLAGVAVDANAASTITVKNSDFSNWGYYGVQIHQGKVDVDSNHFTGGGLNAVRIDGAYQYAVTGGHIRYNTFQGLQNPNATGIYIYGVRDDGLDTAQNLLQDNLITNCAGADQVGIQVINCLGALRFFRNSIHGGLGLPGYGILNYTTNFRMYGDTLSEESKSEIFGTTYGLYCFNGSVDDTDHATVRGCSFSSYGSAMGSPGYDVWVSDYGKVNLGGPADLGVNVFHGRCSGSGSPFNYTVCNNNSNPGTTIRARGNRWAISGSYLIVEGEEGEQGSIPPCGCGSVWWPDPLDHNPFHGGGYAKLAVYQEEPSEPGIEEFGHLMNYPNPFNASTVLAFSLADPGPVEVAVYNVLGQRVKTVCNEDRGAGEHQVTWDGRDERGKPVASGVYFYTVTTGNKRLSKSIVLLK